jgi:hypothetical protein
VDAGLRDDLLFRTLWDIALSERKSGRPDAALAVWTDLTAVRNPYQVRALDTVTGKLRDGAVADKNEGD